VIRTAKAEFRCEDGGCFGRNRSQVIALSEGAEAGIATTGELKQGLAGVRGAEYRGTIWAKAGRKASLCVAAESADGRPIAKARLDVSPGDWRRLPPVLFLARPMLSAPPAVGCDHWAARPTQPGSAICVWEPTRGDSVRTVFSDPNGSIYDLNLSLDARTVFFSFLREGEKHWHLWRIGVDGTGRRQITDGPFYDVGPCELPDGRLLFMRWEYVDRDLGYRQALWTENPDGSAYQLYFGNTIRDPATFWQARSLPGHRRPPASLGVPRSVPASCDAASAGTGPACVRRQFWAGPARGARGRCPADGHVRRDGRLPGGSPTIARGRVKSLRIMEQVRKTENIPVTPHVVDFGPRAYDQSPLMGYGTYYAKRCWGTVPVEEDGSAHFKVPALREIYFQVCDGEGRELQRMTSAMQVMPGEVTGCVGCHEGRSFAPPPVARMPLAARRAASQPQQPAWAPDGIVDFLHVVQPMLDKYCVECHRGGDPAGGCDLSGDKSRFFSVAYDNLLGRSRSYRLPWPVPRVAAGDLLGRADRLDQLHPSAVERRTDRPSPQGCRRAGHRDDARRPADPHVQRHRRCGLSGAASVHRRGEATGRPRPRARHAGLLGARAGAARLDSLRPRLDVTSWA
jgi:hypothetical protein